MHFSATPDSKAFPPREETVTASRKFGWLNSDLPNEEAYRIRVSRYVGLITSCSASSYRPDTYSCIYKMNQEEVTVSAIVRKVRINTCLVLNGHRDKAV